MTDERSSRRLWWDLASVLGVFAVCPVAAHFAPADPAGPIEAGLAIARLEERIGVAVEPAWSTWLASHHSLAIALAALYLFVHVPATAGLLIWLRIDRPAAFPRARDALVAAQALTIGANLLWPVAPPRLVTAGAADPVAALTGPEVGGMSSLLQSPYAAMPSGHVAFAVIVGLALLQQRRTVPAPLAVAYPVAISVIVVLTGNHYVLDIVGGVIAAGVGWVVVGLRPAASPGRVRRDHRTSTASVPARKVSTG